MKTNRIYALEQIKNDSTILICNQDLDNLAESLGSINIVKAKAKIRPRGTFAYIQTSPTSQDEIAISDVLINTNFVYAIVTHDEEYKQYMREVKAKRIARKDARLARKYRKILLNNNIDLQDAQTHKKPSKKTKYKVIHTLSHHLSLVSGMIPAYSMFYRDGNTIKCETSVMQTLKSSTLKREIMAIGIATCDSEDTFDMAIGMNIAFAKATANLVTKLY